MENRPRLFLTAHGSQQEPAGGQWGWREDGTKGRQGPAGAGNTEAAADSTRSPGPAHDSNSSVTPKQLWHSHQHPSGHQNLEVTLALRPASHIFQIMLRE
ncbi:uncharacterized protein LOC101058966 isoform X1 [Pan troglodytes]|uniref:Uncharacterized protein n=1 Tax=Pan troglodytes TaxID=9598 RepID=G2HJ90_PANTR|nr:uncharacterized protein LOC101058966 [Pan troglodytes]XP_016804797.2 uncharacterized protein LOC101058966 isoform X1 [Pan troglodytes]BAK63798.1 hypothetical protein [Pan troglodytes]